MLFLRGVLGLGVTEARVTRRFSPPTKLGRPVLVLGFGIRLPNCRGVLVPAGKGLGFLPGPERPSPARSFCLGFLGTGVSFLLGKSCSPPLL